MELKFDEYGRLVAGQTNSDGSEITAEQISEALAKKFTELNSSRSDLERKLSTQGEELSNTRAALDAYGRGSSRQPKADDGDGDEFPDPLEKPEEFKKALDNKLRKNKEDAKKEIEALYQAREYARKTREAFFSKYPDLGQWDKLVDYITGMYMEAHGNDALLRNNPDEFQKIAFEAISAEARKQLTEMYGGTMPKPKKNAPFFEVGSSSSEGRGGNQGALNVEPVSFSSEEELNDSNLDSYMKDKKTARNGRK